MEEDRKSSVNAADLSEAIKSGQITLAYQPKVSLGSGEIVGVEALARWRHPDLGIVPPTDFIPLAEASGLIDPLTELVVATAAQDWGVWRAQGLKTNIAVNVSARSLDRLDFPDTVAGICRMYGMPSRHMMIELTEGATQRADNLLDTLTRFRIKGMGIALDDFGTGYSSLLQLQQLPFSEMKIDRSFVMHADTSRDCRVIVRATIHLAHDLGLHVVAEGVEGPAVRNLLTDLGCDIAQGYFFAKPMPAVEWVAWALSRLTGFAGQRGVRTGIST